MQFQQKTCSTLTDAEQTAKELSAKNKDLELAVIRSNGMYYIEESPMIRVWEKLCSTWVNGKRLID